MTDNIEHPEKLHDAIKVLAQKLDGMLTDDQWAELPSTLLDAMKQQRVISVSLTPEHTTERMLHYEFTSSGKDLKVGEEIIVIIPNGTNLHLETIVLGHRKREAFWGDTSSSYDSNGAYTEILVLDGNTGKWVSWEDPLGHTPIKYAERRASVEFEHLGMWFGMVGDINPVAIKLISRGQGNPSMSVATEISLDVITRPDIHDTTEILERIYTPGTKFSDYSQSAHSSSARHRFGGGKDSHAQRFGFSKGGYPKAVPLREKRGYEPFELTEKVNTEKERLDEQGRFHIKLPVGKKLLSLEISAGCKWTNSPVGNPPKPIGIPGGHKLDAYLVSKDGVIDRFIYSANVGAEGVIMGGPTKRNYKTQEGDEIILVCPKGTIYLMGWRLIMDSQPSHAVHEAIGLTKTSIQETTAGIPPFDLIPTGEIGGGTQGGAWHKNVETNERYFVKSYSHENPEVAKDRCATEFIASTIYRKMGILVPETHMFHGKVASKEIKGLKLFPYSWDLGKEDNSKKAKNFFGKSEDVKNGFVVDAWLAHWDVFGLNYDNILQDSTGRCYRVDFGGALFYRGMGSYKPQFGQEAVTEIHTMRDPQKAREAGYIFHDLITDGDIKKQIEKLCQTMTDDVIREIVEESEISNANLVINTFIKRKNWLKHYGAKL